MATMSDGRTCMVWIHRQLEEELPERVKKKSRPINYHLQQVDEEVAMIANWNVRTPVAMIVIEIEIARLEHELHMPGAIAMKIILVAH